MLFCRMCLRSDPTTNTCGFRMAWGSVFGVICWVPVQAQISLCCCHVAAGEVVDALRAQMLKQASPLEASQDSTIQKTEVARGTLWVPRRTLAPDGKARANTCLVLDRLWGQPRFKQKGEREKRGSRRDIMGPRVVYISLTSSELSLDRLLLGHRAPRGLAPRS